MALDWIVAVITEEDPQKTASNPSYKLVTILTLGLPWHGDMFYHSLFTIMAQYDSPGLAQALVKSSAANAVNLMAIVSP